MEQAQVWARLYFISLVYAFILLDRNPVLLRGLRRTLETEAVLHYNFPEFVMAAGSMRPPRKRTRRVQYNR